jgi:hypothetical protein
MRAVLTVVALLATGAAATDTTTYPLDAYAQTGIRRLEVYRRINAGEMPGNLRFPPGALLPTDAIRLRLHGLNDSFDLTADTPRDSSLQAAIDQLVGARDPSYYIAILDVSDPLQPRYAAVREGRGYIPGSVGKLVVLTGLFNELAQLYPHDVEARARLLRETRIVADRWVIPNSHAVPVVNADMTGVSHRAIRVGDEFTLWEWVDHMMSPSSNAAASMVWKQALLMDAFGYRYPPTAEEEKTFFDGTSRQELSDRAVRVVEEPLLAAGIDTAGLRQRTFFTNTAQAIVPGQGSYSTPRQLVRWMLRLEQGRLVDPWSSLEMKRLMYFTRRRYRYAASPALREAAVYFKSGSLYRCQEEPGFQCGQYRGNAQNLMHSVAIVESPATGDSQRVYVVSMMSNVLKLNSAGEHAEIATRIERLLAGGQ